VGSCTLLWLSSILSLAISLFSFSPAFALALLAICPLSTPSSRRVSGISFLSVSALFSHSSSGPPSPCSSSSAAWTVHTRTAASHAASVSLLSTASLNSAIALLMLSGNGLDRDSAQYCSMRSSFASTCSTVSPLSRVDCAGSVTVSVYSGADWFAVVVGSTIEYVAIGAVLSCCLWK
jgi:hypothetical protein